MLRVAEPFLAWSPHAPKPRGSKPTGAGQGPGLPQWCMYQLAPGAVPTARSRFAITAAVSPSVRRTVAELAMRAAYPPRARMRAMVRSEPMVARARAVMFSVVFVVVM